MNQLNSINKLKKMIPNVTGIDVALLYGSFGRNEATPNSDIDIQLLVNSDFDITFLRDQLKFEFDSEVQNICSVNIRNKVVVYFKSNPKIEFAICKNLSDIDKNYLGSAITNIRETILFEKCPLKYKIETYLQNLVFECDKSKTEENNKKYISNLIDKFVYEFESCSNMHRRSDGYQFYFFYNCALQVAVQLHHLSKGNVKYNFLPKYFMANILTKTEQESFYSLKGTLSLPEANMQKRKLLDFFYSAIKELVISSQLNEVIRFCEWIFNRDFFWNFRDISTYNPKIKSGIIYRTATLALFQNENRFHELLKDKKIRTIIDLRSDREIEDIPYQAQTLLQFKYIKAQFDPWNQPEWFKESHRHGNDEEIAYRFFAIGCNDKIKSAMNAIIDEENGSVAIHCFAGKDRTGIFISMLHLLVESPIEIIHADYLASEVDVKLYRLNIVLNIIEEEGGIIPYLLFCGLTLNQILKLKQKILNK
jgi:predicted nucleotidyltransferase